MLDLGGSHQKDISDALKEDIDDETTDSLSRLSPTSRAIRRFRPDIPQDIIEMVVTKLSEDSDTKKKEDGDITLSIWDFAGQQLYYTTHQVSVSIWPVTKRNYNEEEQTGHCPFGNFYLKNLHYFSIWCSIVMKWTYEL